MKQLVSLLVIAIFATQCTCSTDPARRRRAAEENGGNDKQDENLVPVISSAIGILESFPIVGGVFMTVRMRIETAFQKVLDATNGGLARVLGGSLPCKLSYNNGLRCTGITRAGDFTKLIIDVLKEALFPEFATNIIASLLQDLLEPTLGVIFGGVTTEHV